jgi:hypothetical protein
MSQFAPDRRATQLANGLIDLERYPIDRPDSAELATAVASARAALAVDGCVVLTGFIAPEARGMFEAESRAVAPGAWHSESMVNPYNTADDPTLPQDDPRRMFQPHRVGFVASDYFAASGPVKRLWRDGQFQRFLGRLVGIDEVHTYDDPLAGVVVNVMPDGSDLEWHYDANEFVVSLLTKEPDEGGSFEYCPNIRSAGDEHYDTVGDVLRGDRAAVRTIDLGRGDLQVFFGRYSLHRVVPLRGERHTVIFGYAREPHTIGTAARARMLFGRSHEYHDRRPRSDDGLLTG